MTTIRKKAATISALVRRAFDKRLTYAGLTEVTG